jgi:hypothetical protein
MRHIGKFTVSWNPYGPRLVISRRDERGQLIVAMGGWFLGRKAWPRREFFSVRRYP